MRKPARNTGRRLYVRFALIATDLCAPRRTTRCAMSGLMHRSKPPPSAFEGKPVHSGVRLDWRDGFTQSPDPPAPALKRES